MARARAMRDFGRWLAAELGDVRAAADYRGMIAADRPGDYRGLAAQSSSGGPAAGLPGSFERPWRTLAGLLGFAGGVATGAEIKRRSAKRRKRTAALAGRL